MSTYLVHVTFMSIDGMDLVHSYETISADPEMLAQLKASVIDKVNLIEIFVFQTDITRQEWSTEMSWNL